MKNALQDQLLKLGLGKQSNLRQHQTEQEKQRKSQGKSQGRKDPAATAPSAEDLARQAREDKARRDAELQAQRQERQRRQELAAQIRQIISQHQVPRTRGEESHQFVQAGRIKKLAMTAEIKEKILAGQLVIVASGDGHALLPPEAAEKIRSRDPDWFMVSLTPSSPAVQTDGDDPYAAYTIPDDLMW